jgi:RNA polymerase sigma-70 factor (ECF subfamily)
VDLEAAVAALAPRLLAYALGRTGCRGTAEDVAQDALVALVRRWQKHGPPRSPDAFVFAIARRRAGRANARRAMMAPIETLRTMASDRLNPEQAYKERCEIDAMLAALRRLRRSEREVLLLRIAGDLSTEDIAVITRSTASAVKMRVHRARRRLAHLLSEDPNGLRRQNV